MEVDCVYNGPDGTSRIARVKLPLIEKVARADGTLGYDGLNEGGGWGIAVGPAGEAPFGEWHPVTHPLLSIVLAGEWEVEAGDGETRRLGPGSLTVFLDREGQGHRSRITSKEDGCTSIGVRLDAASIAALEAQIRD